MEKWILRILDTPFRFIIWIMTYFVVIIPFPFVSADGHLVYQWITWGLLMPWTTAVFVVKPLSRSFCQRFDSVTERLHIYPGNVTALLILLFCLPAMINLLPKYAHY